MSIAVAWFTTIIGLGVLFCGARKSFMQELQRVPKNRVTRSGSALELSGIVALGLFLAGLASAV